MSLEQLLYGVFGGDMGALNALFALMFPIGFVAFFIAEWRRDRNGKKGL